MIHAQSRIGASPLAFSLYKGLLRDGQGTVSNFDAVHRLAVSLGHANKLLHDMNRQGLVFRVGRGLYAVSDPHQLAEPNKAQVDPFALLDHLMRSLETDYYVAYSAAAFLHGLSDQVPFNPSVAVPNWRRPITLQASRIVFHQVPHEHFWGHQRLAYRGNYLTVSNPWRTLLDCASRPEISGGLEELSKMVGEAVRRSSQADVPSWPEPSADYASRYPEKSALQRLGYLFKACAPGVGTSAYRFMEFLRANRGPNIIRLDPQSESSGSVDAEWGVQDNVNEMRLQIA